MNDETGKDSAKDAIEKIKGNNKVLLVAPHGNKLDDENTGLLTREIAKKLNCYAIINETYKKPNKENKPDPANNLINLNRRKQAEKYLKRKFLEPLDGYVKEIIDKYDSAMILWMHGIKDENIDASSVDKDPSTVHVLLGVGQGDVNRITAKEHTVKKLIYCLRDNGNGKKVSAALAKKGSDYCGNNTNIMNQYFREKYPLSKVQSMQLEIKFTGFRDVENIPKTADAFSSSISKLIAPLELQNIGEEHPDGGLVDQAYQKLSEIFSRHFENAMMEAGQYLIDKFYGGDIEKARKKEPVNGESFFQLTSRLHSRGSGGPSKSWVYNAIKLVVESHDLKDFHTYGKLALSQKILLLPLSDRKQKEQLIDEAVKKDLTVAQLKEEIAKVKSAKPKKSPSRKGLKGVIGNPEILFNEEFKPATEVKSLLEHSVDNLEDLLKRAQTKKTEIDSEIKALTKFSENYERLAERIGEAIKENRHKAATAIAIQETNNAKTNHFIYEGKTGIGKSKEFQKKQLADFSCNIGNICLFGCTYCYVPSVTIKQQSVQKILKKGFAWQEITHYRTKENLLNCVQRDLKKIKPEDNRTVIFCTTCDPCATEEHADITSSAIRCIMESSGLQVRVLSKSKLIFEIAKELNLYRDRIIYGLSTGTIRPEISACIEGNASPIEERLEILKTMQDCGYRTFGMLCPMLPSEIPYLEKLVKAIRPARCEHVWAEAINLRGKSLVRTRDQLKKCGLNRDAQSLENVMGSKRKWREYSKDLFLRVQHELKERDALDKLRYLQYVTREPDDFTNFFESQIGAIPLGTKTIENPEMSTSGKNWNVVTGCDKYSDGCLKCYAKRLVPRLQRFGQEKYIQNGFKVTMHEDKLSWPLNDLSKRPKKPARSFVTDMGDLFHKKVSDDFILRVFSTMLKVPQHRFYVLTKRAERLGELGPKLPWKPWMWAGVTVESNEYLDRIDRLKELPPEVNKFLMLEPLLSDMPELDLDGIHWVVVGGETDGSNNFRPMEEEWVINIRDQVKAAGLPFMFKHWPGRNHNAREALLEGKIWAEYPESVIRNMDWDA